MTDDLARKHARLASQFTALVDGVTHWDAPSPVAQWRARDVVAHLTQWLPGMLSGYGVDLVTETGEDPAQVWRRHSANVQALLADDDVLSRVVTTSGGTRTIGQVINDFYLADVFMHMWDLAMSAGTYPDWDPEEAGRMADGMAAIRDLLADSGQFGDPVILDATHSPQDRLAAIMGRDVSWQPSR